MFSSNSHGLSLSNSPRDSFLLANEVNCINQKRGGLSRCDSLQTQGGAVGHDPRAIHIDSKGGLLRGEVHQTEGGAVGHDSRAIHIDTKGSGFRRSRSQSLQTEDGAVSPDPRAIHIDTKGSGLRLGRCQSPPLQKQTRQQVRGAMLALGCPAQLDEAPLRRQAEPKPLTKCWSESMLPQQQCNYTVHAEDYALLLSRPSVRSEAPHAPRAAWNKHHHQAKSPIEDNSVNLLPAMGFQNGPAKPLQANKTSPHVSQVDVDELLANSVNESRNSMQQLKKDLKRTTLKSRHSMKHDASMPLLTERIRCTSMESDVKAEAGSWDLADPSMESKPSCSTDDYIPSSVVEHAEANPSMESTLVSSRCYEGIRVYDITPATTAPGSKEASPVSLSPKSCWPRQEQEPTLTRTMSAASIPGRPPLRLGQSKSAVFSRDAAPKKDSTPKIRSPQKHHGLVKSQPKDVYRRTSKPDDDTTVHHSPSPTHIASGSRVRSYPHEGTYTPSTTPSTIVHAALARTKQTALEVFAMFDLKKLQSTPLALATREQVHAKPILQFPRSTHTPPTPRSSVMGG